MLFTERLFGLSERLVAAVEVLAGITDRSGPTGWGNYVDSQYPDSGTVLSVSADTDTLIPNDALGSLTNESQLPTDIEKFYDGPTQKIFGPNGDGMAVTLDMIVVPTSAATTLIETWIDIGAPVGELYRRPTTFPKGQGVPRQIVQTTAVYSLDTWETNAGQFWMRANGTCDVYAVRFIFHRLHAAR